MYSNVNSSQRRSTGTATYLDERSQTFQSNQNENETRFSNEFSIECDHVHRPYGHWTRFVHTNDFHFMCPCAVAICLFGFVWRLKRFNLCWTTATKELSGRNDLKTRKLLLLKSHVLNFQYTAVGRYGRNLRSKFCCLLWTFSIEHYPRSVPLF